MYTKDYSLLSGSRGRGVFADFVVDDKVVVELRETSRLLAQYEAQLLNYLRATRYEVGLLLNFGPKPSHSRKAFANNRKNITWKP